MLIHYCSIRPYINIIISIIIIAIVLLGDLSHKSAAGDHLK